MSAAQPEPEPQPAPAKATSKTARYDALRKVRRDPDLKPGSKVLYQELDDLSGQEGECFVHEKTLARVLTVPTRTIQEWLYPLVKKQYIIRKRTQHGNRYILPRAGAVAVSHSHQNVHGENFPRTSECASDAHPPVRAFKEDPCFFTRRPSSSSSTAGERTGPRRQDDDDNRRPPREEKTQNPSPADPLVSGVRETLLAWAAKNKCEPSGPVPDEAIAQRMREAGAGLADLKNFLYGEFVERLQNLKDSPSSWKYVLTSVRNHLANFDQTTTSSVDAAFERYLAKQREREARAGGQNARSK
jgi:hypothetical protein